jgi:probable HAF family extracellular repeat protein
MRHITKALGFCVVISSVLFAADYRFVRIDFPNATSTTVNTINARGDIVGKYDDANGVTHGFLLHKGIFATIDFPHASSTAVRSINARGEVVGPFDDANGNTHGYLLRDGHFTQIDYPGASFTVAQGINNAGDITGREVGNDGIPFGFILRDGEFHNVRVPGSRNCGTDEWMAQDNGWRAVGDFCLDKDGSVHGFVRNRTGDFQTFRCSRRNLPVYRRSLHQ